MKGLSASLEDYLEAIFHIEESKQVVRAKNIADRMQVRGSSVTGALNQLARRELVNYSPYELVTLTPRGRRAALDVVRRHEALKEFLTGVLGVEEKMAGEYACRMEHSVHKQILDRLVGFVGFLAAYPDGAGERLIEEFKEFHATNREKAEKVK